MMNTMPAHFHITKSNAESRSPVHKYAILKIVPRDFESKNTFRRNFARISSLKAVVHNSRLATTAAASASSCDLSSYLNMNLFLPKFEPTSVLKQTWKLSLQVAKVPAVSTLIRSICLRQPQTNPRGTITSIGFKREKNKRMWSWQRTIITQLFPLSKWEPHEQN